MIKTRNIILFSIMIFLLIPLSNQAKITSSLESHNSSFFLVPLAADTFEDDDTFGTASSIPLNTVQERSVFPIADKDYIIFELDSYYEISIETSGTSGDTCMWLFDADENQLDYDDNSGTDLFSRIDQYFLNPGNYYLLIEEKGNDAEIDTYYLYVTATLIVDPYEGDSSNSPTIIPYNSSITKSINPVTDDDWFTFTIYNTYNITLETSGIDTGDSVMGICYDSSDYVNTLITEDDDGGEGAYSKITLTNLAPGSYYVKVIDYGDNSIIEYYSLHLTVYSDSYSDTQIPTISGVGHSLSEQYGSAAASITASLTDAFGISEGFVHYRINEGSWLQSKLVNTFYNQYNCSIGPFEEKDMIEYYISAEDNSSNHNAATDNNGGVYYSFTILNNDFAGPTIDNIQHIPSSPNDEQSVLFNCTATDVNGIQSVSLFYRINGGSFVEELMLHDTGDIYTVTLGIFDYDDLIEYYIYAVDNSTNDNPSLDNNSGSFYSFSISSGDFTTPIIDNVQIIPVNPVDTLAVLFNCTVTDNNDIQKVELHYQVNSGGWDNITMINVSGDIYEIELGPFDYNDVIEYFFFAVDDSPNHNIATKDNIGFPYIFTVLSGDVTGPTIKNVEHTPTIPTDIQHVIINCNVTDENGIQSVTLYYRINGTSWSNCVMTLIADSIYEADIGPFDYNVHIEYFIRAIDNSPNLNPTDENNDSEYYNFDVVSSDVTPPSISSVLQSVAEPIDGLSIQVNCSVSDASGIYSVTLVYRTNLGTWTELTMTLVSGTIYETSLGPFSVGDVVEYYIIAVDNSPYHYETVENNDGEYFGFVVQPSSTSKSSLHLFIPLLLSMYTIIWLKKKYQ